MRAGITAFLFVFVPAQGLAETISVRDDVGRNVQLERPARRIISLSPHITEMLFAIGAGEQLVGVAENSDFPPAAKNIPRVSGAARLDLERILALSPDLIVAWHSGNPVQAMEPLHRLGIPLFYSEPRRLEDIARNLQRLGRLAGKNNRGLIAANKFRSRHQALARRNNMNKPAIRVFYQLWHRPLMTVNGQHLITDVIKLCGGINIFGDLPALTPVVSKEAVIAAHPQVIISGDRQREDLYNDWQAWANIPAVSKRHLYSIPAALIHRQGPRILDGAEIMCRILRKVD